MQYNQALEMLQESINSDDLRDEIWKYVEQGEGYLTSKHCDKILEYIAYQLTDEDDEPNIIQDTINISNPY